MNIIVLLSLNSRISVYQVILYYHNLFNKFMINFHVFYSTLNIKKFQGHFAETAEDALKAKES